MARLHFFCNQRCMHNREAGRESQPCQPGICPGRDKSRDEERSSGPPASPHIVNWVPLRLGDEASHGNGAQMWKDTDGVMRDCQNRLFSLI